MIRIAIDGPGGAGKSTIAKRIAKEKDIDYIDTGAMYRAIAYKMAQKGIEAKSSKVLEEMLDDTDIDFSKGNIYLDGENVNDKIRTPEISMKASECSSLPEVRKKLTDLQRGMAASKSIIMDGRDIGSNVLPDAEFKFFLTADAMERAKRRYDELIAKGESANLNEVYEDIRQRDHNDMTRKLNPLRQAPDAILVDTTDMNIEEVITHICGIINGK